MTDEENAAARQSRVRDAIDAAMAALLAYRQCIGTILPVCYKSALWEDAKDAMRALARLQEDDLGDECVGATQVVRDLAKADPVSYEEWLGGPAGGPGFLCHLCGCMTAESEPGFNAQDKSTAVHANTCPWTAAKALVKKEEA